MARIEPGTSVLPFLCSINSTNVVDVLKIKGRSKGNNIDQNLFCFYFLVDTHHHARTRKRGVEISLR